MGSKAVGELARDLGYTVEYLGAYKHGFGLVRVRSSEGATISLTGWPEDYLPPLEDVFTTMVGAFLDHQYEWDMEIIVALLDDDTSLITELPDRLHWMAEFLEQVDAFPRILGEHEEEFFDAYYEED